MRAVDYFKYAGYALIAIGLINLQYQWGQEGALLSSSAIVAAGLGLFALTILQPTRELLAKRSYQITLWLLVLLLIIFAIVN
jgi:hypothetical protein